MGIEPSRPARSLADAEPAEDPVEQVVRVHRPDHLPNLIEGEPQFQGKQLGRLVEQGRRGGRSSGGPAPSRRGAGSGSGSGPGPGPAPPSPARRTAAAGRRCPGRSSRWSPAGRSARAARSALGEHGDRPGGVIARRLTPLGSPLVGRGRTTGPGRPGRLLAAEALGLLLDRVARLLPAGRVDQLDVRPLERHRAG